MAEEEAVQEDEELFELGADLAEEAQERPGEQTEERTAPAGDAEKLALPTLTGTTYHVAPNELDKVDWSHIDLNALPDDVSIPASQLKRIGVRSAPSEDRNADFQRLSQTQERTEQSIQKLAEQQQAQPAADQPDLISELGFTPGSEEYATAEAVARISRALMEREIKARDEKIAALEAGIGEVRGSVGEVSTYMQYQAQATTERELQEVRTLYGDDPDQYADEIVALRGKLDRRTGQPYTLRTAYEFASGKSKELSEQLKAKEQELKAGYKTSAAAGSSAGNGGIEAQLPQSDAELVAAVQASTNME